jgi:hypothetical protein
VQYQPLTTIEPYVEVPMLPGDMPAIHYKAGALMPAGKYNKTMHRDGLCIKPPHSTTNSKSTTNIHNMGI